MNHGWIRVRFWMPFGAEVWLHWTLVVIVSCALLLAARQPAAMGLVLAAYFLALVVHESGHAWMARRLGYRVARLEFSPFHGRCHVEACELPVADHARIARAGPMAQLGLAGVVLGLGQIPAIRAFDPFGPVYVFAGLFNVWWAVLNLLPFRGLDGEHAWKGLLSGRVRSVLRPRIRTSRPPPWRRK